MRIKPDLAQECGFGIADFLCRAPRIDPQQKRDQALNDGSVGAGMEGNLAEFVDDLAGGVCGTVHDGCILSN